MTPTIHCVRHAQGYHNLNIENHSIHDPTLTQFGELQCQHLCNVFPYHDKIDLLCASPLTRTIQTALLSFQPEVAQGMKVICLPLAQETADLPCDTGKNVDALRKQFANQPVDLELVHEGWNVKKDIYAPNPEALTARAKELRRWLRNRPEKDIVLVTHGGFLHYFSGDWSDYTKYLGTGWANTETRSYTFNGSDDDDAAITETDESKKARAGREHPLTQDEILRLTKAEKAKKREKNTL